MKSLMHLSNKQIKIHILIWIMLILYLNIFYPIPGNWFVKILGAILINLNYAFVFYIVSLFIFPKIWMRKRIYIILTIILCFIIYYGYEYYLYVKIIPFFGGSTEYQDSTLFLFFPYSFFYFVIVVSAGSTSFFYRYSLYNLKQQIEKEKILLVKELNFLKNQFNSHITFNFLNYCYSKIHQLAPETAESIELFSDMLHYTLQTKPEEKVSINDEIIYIESFIKLQKLLSTKVYANYNYEGKIENLYVLPRILITFVENAFKHGLCNDPQHPIQINMQVDENKLFFTVKNKINQNKKLVSSNTGLENVNQILDLYYVNNYELKAEEKDGFFNVKLHINL